MALGDDCGNRNQQGTGALGGVQHAVIGRRKFGAEGIALGGGKQAEDFAIHAEIQRRHQHEGHGIGAGLAQGEQRDRPDGERQRHGVFAADLI